MTRPATTTTTRAGFRSIVMEWSGPGTFARLSVMCCPQDANPRTRSLGRETCLLNRGPAAVDGDNRSGHITGTWRGQECHDLGDLRRIGRTLHGCGGAERVEEFPRLGACVDRAWRDRIDPDAARAVLRRPCLSE